MDSIKVFSPGSVTNLSCGYDVLGVCLENRGDEIEVHKTKSIGLEIESLDNYNISNKIDQNVAGIAAKAMLESIDIDFGFKIIISAATGSKATNRIFLIIVIPLIIY